LSGELSAEALNALTHLQEFGIHLSEAKRLLEKNEPGRILDMIEYVSALASEPGSTVRSAQSLLVSKLREGTRIPIDFVTSRQRRAKEAARNWVETKRQYEAALELEYEQWYGQQGEDELRRIYEGAELDKKLNAVSEELARADKLFARMTRSAQRDVARNRLVKELSDQLMLPSFEEWCKENAQRELFNNQ
jgi:hypothetical protein